jgi:hypothetical protein
MSFVNYRLAVSWTPRTKEGGDRRIKGVSDILCDGKITREGVLKPQEIISHIWKKGHFVPQIPRT